MKWTVEEDDICCRACVAEYVINKRHMNIDSLVADIVKNHRIRRGAGTVRMRM